MESISAVVKPGPPATDVVLRDGSVVHVWPAGPADEAAITAFLDRMSPRSLHLRFGTAAPNLEAAAHQWALPPTRGHVSLLAVTGADHEVVGEASYEELRRDRAEFALAIGDVQRSP